MASLYTQQLANSSWAGPTTAVVYTVPAGYTVVVTCIDIYADSSAAGQLSAVLLGAAAVLYSLSPAAGVSNRSWQGRQALVGGQTITVVSQSANLTRLGVTGYVLPPLP